MPIKQAIPRSSRVTRARRGVGVALSAVACVALLGACGSSSSSKSTATKTNLDTTRVARSIAASILSERHLKANVNCPAVVPQEAGKTFECIALTTSPKKPHLVVKTPFVVTVQSDKGYVTYVGK